VKGEPVPDRHVALLRGINVGKAKRIAMADLRALVAELGYGDVSTLLNSGNVVFTAPGADPEDAARRIQDALRERTGVSARVVVLTAREIAQAVEGNPWRDEVLDPSRLLVTVLYDPADRRKLEPLMDQDWGTDRLALAGRVAYVWCPDGVLQSKLPDAAARVLRDAATSRNWATMLKLHARVHDPAS
jgi:uncharacterized protein (DUF1697 family)